MKHDHFWFGMLENIFHHFEIILLQVFNLYKVFYSRFLNLKMKSYYMENLDITFSV